MSSYSLEFYVLGLTAFMLIKVLAPGYFARQDMKTPVKIGMIAIATGMAIKAIIVFPLNHYLQVGHVGLAFSTAIAAYVNAWLLYRGLRKNDVYVPASDWLKVWARYGLANCMMAVALVAGLMLFTDWHAWSSWSRVWHLSILCGAGIFAYFAGLALAGFKMKDFRAPH
jgi:putative peptidoglycan lipid II flippase